MFQRYAMPWFHQHGGYEYFARSGRNGYPREERYYDVVEPLNGIDVTIPGYFFASTNRTDIFLSGCHSALYEREPRESRRTHARLAK